MSNITLQYNIFAAKFQLSNYLTDQSSLKKNDKPKNKVTQNDLSFAKEVLDKYASPNPMTRSVAMKNSDSLHRTMIKVDFGVVTGIET